ncbi:MAG: NADP-dependent oxidoreductase [Propionicimonas sp.]|uniref:NADP-dependent oxidoreductase n=1 Tax=Propionicimonas sp. TaxID=1955623 RepID=UPI003D0F1FB7
MPGQRGRLWAGVRAVVFSRYGGPEVLTPTEVAEPTAGPGRIRVRVRAAGVNPYDYKVRSGMMSNGAQVPDAPVVPGQEAAGVVDQMGEGVTGVSVGDEVFGLGSRAYAERAVLRAWAPKPAGLDWPQAAALGVAGETATRILNALALPQGATLLVHGAAGGVGQAVVQLGRVAGLRVIGTARARNHDLLRGLGAEPTTYGEGLPARVAALAPDGVDGVADTAGSQLDDLIAVAGSADRVVTIANYSAAERGVRFTGGGEDASAALARVGELAAQGRFAVRVAATFDLADAAEAQRLSEARGSGGKIVLIVQ